MSQVIMYIVKAIKYSINKRILEYKQSQLWKKYGSQTRYHFVDSCFEIGEHTYGVPVLYRYDHITTLKIGSYCSLADGVKIMLGGNHHIERISTYSFFEEMDEFPECGGWTERACGNIKIGNDVWIGRDALILSGVTIGDGAVIGAGAVVAKDIPPYAIAVGNPIRVIKYRFEEAQIKALERIQWWNWDVKKINKYMKYFCSENIDGFIEEQLGSNWRNEL